MPLFSGCLCLRVISGRERYLTRQRLISDRERCRRPTRSRHQPSYPRGPPRSRKGRGLWRVKQTANVNVASGLAARSGLHKKNSQCAAAGGGGDLPCHVSHLVRLPVLLLLVGDALCHFVRHDGTPTKQYYSLAWLAVLVLTLLRSALDRDRNPLYKINPWLEVDLC
jgi:hypothetical protein